MGQITLYIDTTYETHLEHNQHTRLGLTELISKTGTGKTNMGTETQGACGNTRDRETKSDSMSLNLHQLVPVASRVTACSACNISSGYNSRHGTCQPTLGQQCS